MARSYSIREGVAVGGKFVGLVQRTIPRPDREARLAEALRVKNRRIEAYMKPPDSEFENTMHKTREGWIAEAQKDYERDVGIANESVSLNVIGREGASPERLAALEKIRENSAVKDVIFRGQAAYEILDSKKAAEIIKKKNEELRSYDKHKPTSMWQTGGQGSRGDGLYHMTEDPTYASEYAYSVSGEKGGIVEGVIDSKHLLNIRSLGQSIKGWYANHPEMAEEKRKHDSQYWNDFSPQTIGSSGRKAYASALVDLVAEQYEKSFGKQMSEKAGVRKYDIDNSPNVFGSGDKYKDLKNAVYQQMKSKDSLGMTYMVMKMPFFKKLLKDTKFDTVAYFDYGESPAYAVTSPSQFKSYYGDKPVDKKSPNMFDAGPA